MNRFGSILFVALVALAALSPAAFAERPVRFPPGALIAGVAVDGLGPNQAKAAVREVLHERYERRLKIGPQGRARVVLTSRFGLRINYAGMIARGQDRARDGEPVDVPLDLGVSGRLTSATLSELARSYYRAPRNASVRFGITSVVRRRGRNGRALDTAGLRSRVLDELRNPTERRLVRAPLRTVKPSVSLGELRSVYANFISVDRRSFTVRVFRRLRVVKSYRVAVGAGGYATPAGLHRIIGKRINPTWYVPDRAWAGDQRGKVVPPGPNNPLKARFLAIGGGVGFHGTGDLASLGSRASHGCIRMRIPDVKDLYRRVPVGTPVLIR